MEQYRVSCLGTPAFRHTLHDRHGPPLENSDQSAGSLLALRGHTPEEQRC